ncbi:hypothetical protein [Embleya sp. NPDC059237]|uniref:hypothetical protein n=1 Tax=Embleya sp. NPDC059237 TaxID=3346784 RepID=UPI0036B608F6
MSRLEQALREHRRALDDAFADYDAAAATRRLASRIVQEGLAASLIRPHAVPARGEERADAGENAARGRAAAEVEHLCRLVLARPDTNRLLGDFVNHRVPDGAIVFACLLYLSGRVEPAVFWWKFAAGAEQGEAMRFLVLHHRAEGEPGDADCWTDRILEDTPPTVPAAVDSDAVVPGNAETYVARAESAIQAIDHPDLGEICTPRAWLHCRLSMAGFA